MPDGSWSITLPTGERLFFDEQDKELAERFFWRRSGGTGRKDQKRYVSRNVWSKDGKQKAYYFHREICGNPEGLWVHFIDNDPLNCRRSNLSVTKPSTVSYFSKENRDKRKNKAPSE